MKQIKNYLLSATVKTPLMASLTTVLLFVISFDCFANIEIRYRNHNEYPGEKHEPIIECEFRATQNGIPIVLNNSNAKLIQADVVNNTSITFEAPQADGYQLARWTSAIATPHIGTFELVVTNNDDVGTRLVPPLYDFGYEIIFSDRDGIRHIQSIALDGKHFFQFLFKVDGSYGTELTWSNRPWVDSITISCPTWRYIWTGSPTAPGIPPIRVNLNTYYLITLERVGGLSSPDEFIREFLTFHFGGGITHRMWISNGENDLETVPTLKLLYPLGNEKFAPCEEVEIKWEGQANLHPVHIQYSTDSKTTWRNIATVSGEISSYIWKIPANVVISDNCFIRISQSFNRNPAKHLYSELDTFQLNSAVFNSEATRAITTSAGANIIEWDLYSSENPMPITVVNSGENSQLSSAIYIENNQKIVALDTQNNNLVFINSGNNSIVKTVALPAGFSAGKLRQDFENRFICIEPNRYGNRILFLTTEGEFVRFYSENVPITNVFFANENELYIALLDNTVKILSLENFPNITVKEELLFAKNYNLIEAFAGSQDSRLIGISFRIQEVPIGSNSVSWGADNIVYDRKNKLLFQNFRFGNEVVHSFDFNPAGTLAIFGVQGSGPRNQIFIYDLTEDNSIIQANSIAFKPFPRRMLEMTLAKTGNSLLAYAWGGFYAGDNCQLINFSFPEAATNKIAFAIKEPALTFSQEVVIKDLIIGTENNFTYQLLLCNSGEVVANIDTVLFENGTHFKFNNAAEIFPIVLFPGECKDISIIVNPLDTGRLNDELKFIACEKDYKFPFTVRGLNRKLTLLNSPFDFGEVCVFESKTVRFNLFRNDDTVDVLINRIVIESSLFVLENSVRDTVLKPGEILTVEITFTPNALGTLDRNLIIRHSNQQNVTVASQLVGTGIGTFLEISHENLPFIPEIRERIITVKNVGEAFLQIDSADFQPEGFYKINTPLPLEIAPEQKVEIAIEFLGNIIGNARLQLFAKPCARIETISLMPYTGTATLSIPQVNANPKDTDASIVVNMRRTELFSYRGERFFYSEFSINPRIFYPKSAVSKFGTAEIIKNEIVNDRRIFGVKITGDFNTFEDELVNISGIAALCEVDNSEINFVSTSDFFGDSVSISYSDGIFQLIDLCPDRLILRKGLTLESIIPNPASTVVTLNFKIFEEINSDIILEIFDLSGSKFFEEKLDGKIKGSYSKTLDVSNFTQGNYQIFIRFEGEILSYSLNIIK